MIDKAGSFTLTPKREKPQAMFLRSGLVNGRAEVDGEEIEIELSQSGAVLIMAVGSFNDPQRITESVSFTALTQAWADKILESRQNA